MLSFLRPLSLLSVRNAEKGRPSLLSKTREPPHILDAGTAYWIAFMEDFAIHIPLGSHALGENVLQWESRTVTAWPIIVQKRATEYAAEKLACGDDAVVGRRYPCHFQRGILVQGLLLLCKMLSKGLHNVTDQLYTRIVHVFVVSILLMLISSLLFSSSELPARPGSVPPFS